MVDYMVWLCYTGGKFSKLLQYRTILTMCAWMILFADLALQRSPSTFLHICVKFRNWNFNDSSHTSLYSCSVCAVKLCTPYFIVLPLQFQETHLTYNVVCYSKYSTLNSLAFLFICFYLSFYILSYSLIYFSLSL